ncbi:MAG: hypothetical protein Roseis2KO_52790 [Roseivirga sp.]
MKLKVTEVDYAPSELYEQTPFEIILTREIRGSDRPDYWIGQLANEINWTKDNEQVKVSHVVVAARWVGTAIQPNVSNLPIGISYVTDLSVLNDKTLDFGKCEYVAIGIAHELEGGSQIEKKKGILSGRIGKLFGRGK